MALRHPLMLESIDERFCPALAAKGNCGMASQHRTGVILSSGELIGERPHVIALINLNVSHPEISDSLIRGFALSIRPAKDRTDCSNERCG